MTVCQDLCQDLLIVHKTQIVKAALQHTIATSEDVPVQITYKLHFAYTGCMLYIRKTLTKFGTKLKTWLAPAPLLAAMTNSVAEAIDDPALSTYSWLALQGKFTEQRMICHSDDAASSH